MNKALCLKYYNYVHTWTFLLAILRSVKDNNMIVLLTAAKSDRLIRRHE